MSSSLLIPTPKFAPKAAFTRCFLPAASLMLALPAGAVLAAPAFAYQEAASSEDNGPQSGTLMLRGKDAKASIPAIMLGTDMDVRVTGNIARVRVTQAFRNVSADWVRGDIFVSATRRSSGR